jgi:hypothetical protein
MRAFALLSCVAVGALAASPLFTFKEEVLGVPMNFPVYKVRLEWAAMWVAIWAEGVFVVWVPLCCCCECPQLCASPGDAFACTFSI